LTKLAFYKTESAFYKKNVTTFITANDIELQYLYSNTGWHVCHQYFVFSVQLLSREFASCLKRPKEKIEITEGSILGMILESHNDVNYWVAENSVFRNSGILFE